MIAYDYWNLLGWWMCSFCVFLSWVKNGENRMVVADFLQNSGEADLVWPESAWIGPNPKNRTTHRRFEKAKLCQTWKIQKSMANLWFLWHRAAEHALFWAMASATRQQEGLGLVWSWTRKSKYEERSLRYTKIISYQFHINIITHRIHVWYIYIC